ncbi:low molecular weight protein-tyrosine-phosphatase [Vibrio panuliri]|uniref:Protein-tyrosine-phosphatase n=1 Tax=Vibrio panuliri TaxID=1381081 RepID=A0ABX3FQ62_9VIBR|nr:low molecular weight protein-tyrosine-phosphatase [Vibrio panuliri]OLQ95910.1 protein-tyrosine-phosphatase [Vibrio panuliri]
MKKILVVCMGNICRSPTGEAVLRAKAQQLGVEVEIDSAGTIGFHQGNLPDERARQAGERRGYSFEGTRSRQVEQRDFSYFDLILAADKDNLHDLKAICPPQYANKLKLYLSFGNAGQQEIPDPYYGGEQGFELVLDLLEDAAEAVLRQR